MFPKGPSAARSLNNTNALGALNHPSNRGTLKIAESNNLLILESQHLKTKLQGPQVSGISNLIKISNLRILSRILLRIFETLLKTELL